MAVSGMQLEEAGLKIRRFVLERLEDATGISGTGVVAHGVHFLESNLAVLNWVTQFRSIAMYQGIEELEAIHGHGGKTRIVWLPTGEQSALNERSRILNQLNTAMENNGGLLIWEKVLHILRQEA